APVAQLAWDGTDAAGAIVTDGSYSFNLTVTDGNGNNQQQVNPNFKLQGDPEGLSLHALTIDPNKDTFEVMKGQAIRLQRLFDQLYTNWGFQGIVGFQGDLKMDTKTMRRWLSGSL